MKVVQRGESARKDSDIALNCESALRWTGDQPSKGVKVAVARGWITLTGMVRWPYQRKAAVMAVRDIPGVTGITDEITLAPANTSGQAQTDIVAALVHRARAKTRRVDAPQKGSEASRTTKVQSWSERNLARQSAWTSRGGSTTREDISKLH
jgi:osmotically-inducible protein OsmY